MINRVLWQKCIYCVRIMFSRFILRAMLVALLAVVYISERSLPCSARKWASSRPGHPRISQSNSRGFFFKNQIGIVLIADDLVLFLKVVQKHHWPSLKRVPHFGFISLLLLFYYYFNDYAHHYHRHQPSKGSVASSDDECQRRFEVGWSRFAQLFCTLLSWSYL